MNWQHRRHATAERGFRDLRCAFLDLPMISAVLIFVIQVIYSLSVCLDATLLCLETSRSLQWTLLLLVFLSPPSASPRLPSRFPLYVDDAYNRTPLCPDDAAGGSDGLCVALPSVRVVLLL
jgi:hypothetical protein